jgi:hypothetical protein
MKRTHNFSWRLLARLIFCIIAPFYTYYSIALHIEGSDFFTGRISKFTGKFNFETYAVEFSITLAVLVLIYIVYKLKSKENLTRTIIYFFLYAISIVHYYMILSLKPLEVVHFFQYFILVFLLGQSLDPQRKQFRFGLILFIASIVGTIDELAQYYILSPGHYHIDFNDIYLNLLSVIGGCLIYYGFKNPPEQSLKPFYKTIRFYMSFGTVLIILIAMLNGTIAHSPKQEILPGYTITESGITFYIERKAGKLGCWVARPKSGVFYNMSATEGVILILLVAASFSSFDRRTFLFIKDPIKKFWFIAAKRK